MTAEETSPAIPTPTRSLLRNPVIRKELRGRMRGSRAFLLLTIYLIVLSIVTLLVYSIYAFSASLPGSTGSLQVFGKIFFGITVWIEVLTISFLAPAFTAGSISSERERQTFELLRITLLPARSLVMGKFISGLSYLLLLLFATLPLQSLAFVFGGVQLSEVLISSLLLLVTAVAFCALGVFLSSLSKSTMLSSLIAYGVSILTFIGFPIIMTAAVSIGGSILATSSLALGGTVAAEGVSTLTLSQQIILLTLGWIAICLNPLTAAAGAEVILLSNRSIWWASIPLSSNPPLTYPVISPWLPYTLIALLAGILLLELSVRLVRRPEK